MDVKYSNEQILKTELLLNETLYCMTLYNIMQHYDAILYNWFLDPWEHWKILVVPYL
jgi:hypothetical protein